MVNMILKLARTAGLAAIVTACATAQSPAQKAESQKIEIQMTDNFPKPNIQELSAGVLMDLGQRNFNTGRFKAAIYFMEKALDTTNLNDAGRTLAYWMIGSSHYALGQEDEGCEALSSFTAVGQEVIEIKDTRRYAVTSEGDFIKRFELEDKLNRARGALNARWAQKVPEFGRSPEYSVPIRNLDEINYFLGGTDSMGCQGEQDAVMQERGQDNYVAAKLCDGEVIDTYYFIRIQEK